MAKILMVDDAGFLEASKTVLEAQGYTVVTAQNVADGEARVNEEKLVKRVKLREELDYVHKQ